MTHLSDIAARERSCNLFTDRDDGTAECKNYGLLSVTQTSRNVARHRVSGLGNGVVSFVTLENLFGMKFTKDLTETRGI